MNDSRKIAQDIKKIKRVSWAGLFVNIALSALKFTVGFLGASQAVIADAVHSLSDLTTDIAVIFGVRFWSAPADEKHPYGHHRIETLITLGIGLILALVAVGIGYKALFAMRELDIKQPSLIAVWGPLVCIILKEGLYHWTISVGKRIKSSALIANAWHHRSDALSSWPAMIAVIVAEFNPDWAFVDHVGALIVSLFILKVSWDIMCPVLGELSGQGLCVAEQKRIEDIVSQIDGIKGLHAVRTRKHGSVVHLDLHVLVVGDISVRQGHDISETVKKELIDQVPEITDVVVHIEPID